MQLIIEISDGLYNNLGTIKNGSIASKIILDCVRKGQVLPKGHGDLKDMEDIYEALEGWDDDTGWIVDAIDSETPTIIEADKEGT